MKCFGGGQQPWLRKPRRRQHRAVGTVKGPSSMADLKFPSPKEVGKAGFLGQAPSWVDKLALGMTRIDSCRRGNFGLRNANQPNVKLLEFEAKGTYMNKNVVLMPGDGIGPEVT